MVTIMTRPKYPEGNLRKLTGDSNPNCGLAGRGRGAGGNYPTKSPNLRHCQARSQNKGLRRASWLWISPSPAGDRQAGQPEPKGGNHDPREASSTKLQAGFAANQDFLGFWMVDICWEGHSQRSAPQKRHTAHLRRHTHCTPRKLRGWDRGGDKLKPFNWG